MPMIGTAFSAALMLLMASTSAQAACIRGWSAGWSAALMLPDKANALPEGSFAGATLRQIVRSTVGGQRVRLRLSNRFGTAPLDITGVTIARPVDKAGAAIVTGTSRPVLFQGAASVRIPAGADYLSDPVDLPTAALDSLTVSIAFLSEPAGQTTHAGARATSYLLAGDHLGDADLAGATRFEHWFTLAGLEVERCDPVGTVVALGDSITDGRGATTNGDDRWPDLLADRLRAARRDRAPAVINLGIGGNRLLLDGLGPNALARFERDVLSQPGVTHLILLEGINDIGTLTRKQPASAAEHDALVARMIQSYAQIVAKAHSHGIKVIGGTILPFMGTDFYHPDAANEADRQAVNRWIRTRGHFDGLIDFDLAMRDPADPARLRAAYDSGDHLHPSPAGYRAMADTIDLTLLR
jgi:lysophospholipase L1-like esterase